MIQSLQRGMMVLEIISKNGSMGVTELAEELGVDKSTVSRILATLKSCDMVQINRSSNKYQLGFRVLHLGEALKNSLNIIELAHPILKKVAKEINQSVHLCVYNNNTVYVIDQVVSNQIYSLSAEVGMVEAIHASSVGKCILAYRSMDYIETLMHGYSFQAYTKKTITNTSDLYVELDKIKQQGYAVDDEELVLGVRCIAVPIFNFYKRVKYSIGVSGPISYMTPEKIEEFRKKLTNVAMEIGRQIGYQSR